MEDSSKLDRQSSTPFLLKLFYRTGSFHRTDELASPSHLPSHLPIYTWTDCTLSELSHYLAAASPPILPSPAIGTRLAFRLVYADVRGGGGGSNAPPRFVAKDLGSLVIGHGGPGADESADEEGDNGGDGSNGAAAAGGGGGEEAGDKTLADAKLVAGDFVSCAILPPLEDTGAVAPPLGAHTGRGSGSGEALAPMRRGGRRGGIGGPRGVGGRGGGPGGGGRGVRQFGDRDRDWNRDRDAGFPSGEWRRGERLPDAPASRGRGRGPRW
ncbi:Sin3 associated polypeptide p18-domain-containing protein [Phialemonium atrogriseum]|uniref:Sin3 associated polypeptide p18-domain-containing protein n=1 Tax=Phialemonium atrogriseum TaxID=1093897 RepID=A0AAJ0C3M0_9PEZI|nr:Sin3 associated polypeptide p18-domain-containing protein [Phialemonium atrogriseum]KAK1768483.1 Sin3 associated polypeptide p18-domain-containing protein [Phialemonium atrogriseum]